ncbi:MAG: hypothetical protein N2689_02600 [Verrucomicrobiae bacterium]|nr:hypothetical protein [Verrucomicrobiae bacterium]
MNVTLIGMKHCGKTTLGSALAARWGCPFYDVDRLIEARYACETGEELSFREIFVRHGEDYFRELETNAVCELYLRECESKGGAVIAVGGGTALNPKVDELLSALGLIVYLEVSVEELVARVTRAGMPAFLDEKAPFDHFAELYRERAPRYRRLANLTVNLDGLDAEAALDKLCRAIEQNAPDKHPTSL